MGLIVFNCGRHQALCSSSGFATFLNRRLASCATAMVVLNTEIFTGNEDTIV